MRYPTLTVPKQTRETTATFGGYNAGLRIGGGEFSEMENMTSDGYPTLSPRKLRRHYADGTILQGLIARDNLCYVDGAYFVMDGYRVNLELSELPAECPKKLISMGAYVIIFPDKKYINTVDLSDYGNLEAHVIARSVTATPCGSDGSEETADYICAAEPDAPTGGQLWLDTSETPCVLRRWSESAGLWVEVEASFVRLSAPNIGKPFSAGDAVTIKGAEDLDGSAIVHSCGEDHLIVSGLLPREAVLAEVSITRSVPEMDFVIESGNRLWGCRYGLNAEGAVVNELYASALGDFKNWNRFQGLSTDSYRVSLGSDGRFTGAITHLGYPLFFKSDCLHKVYGTEPSSYRLQTTPCRGVQPGSEESLAIVGEALYYKSATGVCAYDGSLPREVSPQLGKKSYSRAVAAALGSKYYIAMESEDMVGCLFVYDTARGLWHREDSFRPAALCACRGALYAIRENRREIITLSGGDGAPIEEAVHWYAVTGTIGAGSADSRYLDALLVRLSMDEGSRVHFYLRYDSRGTWEHAGSLTGTGLGSFSVPIRPRRCDHLHLKVAGTGAASIHAITRVMESGGDPL